MSRPRRPSHAQTSAALDAFAPGATYTCTYEGCGLVTTNAEVSAQHARDHLNAIKETTMTTPKDQSLAKPDASLPAIVGEGKPLSLDEWNAMSPAEQRAAIEFFKEEQQETTEGLDVQFPRVRYPTAGSSFWEIPTATGEALAVKEVEGCVVFKQPVRAYWDLDATPGNNPPECSSLDSVVPVSGQGPTGAKTCATCPKSQWGTGKDGRGQACKARLNTFILLPGEDIPTLISLPPTALRTFADYAVQLRKSRSALVAVTTVFGLKNEKSAGGIDYKALTLRIGKPLAYAEMRRAREVREMFERQMARRGVAVDETESDTNGHVPKGEVIDTTGQVVEGQTGERPGF